MAICQRAEHGRAAFCDPQMPGSRPAPRSLFPCSSPIQSGGAGRSMAGAALTTGHPLGLAGCIARSGRTARHSGRRAALHFEPSPWHLAQHTVISWPKNPC